MFSNLPSACTKAARSMDELGFLSDCIIKSADGVEFKVHKAVLAKESPVFREMLHDMPEGCQIISLPETAEELRTALHLVYGWPNPSTDVNLDEMERLLKTSEKYNMQGLKWWCDAQLCTKLRLSLANLPRYMVMASDLHVPRLLAKCKRYLLDNYDANAMQQDLRFLASIDKEMLESILHETQLLHRSNIAKLQALQRELKQTKADVDLVQAAWTTALKKGRKADRAGFAAGAEKALLHYLKTNTDYQLALTRNVVKL